MVVEGQGQDVRQEPSPTMSTASGTRRYTTLAYSVSILALWMIAINRPHTTP